MVQERFGIKLNLLTLSISENQVVKDFEDHKIANQNSKKFFWTVQGLIYFQLAYVVSIILFTGRDVDALVEALGMIIFMGLLWPVTYRWFNRLSKFVFLGWYLTSFISPLIKSFSREEVDLSHVDQMLNFNYTLY